MEGWPVWGGEVWCTSGGDERLMRRGGEMERKIKTKEWVVREDKGDFRTLERRKNKENQLKKIPT